jgi:hypothetical protein
MARKTVVLPIAAALIMSTFQPVFAGDCQGVFMSAVSNIAAFPISALQGFVRFLGAGQNPCGCDYHGGPEQAAYKVITVPAQARAVTTPAYVTYQVMQPVRPAPVPAYAPNTYLYAPLPFHQ